MEMEMTSKNATVLLHHGSHTITAVEPEEAWRQKDKVPHPAEKHKSWLAELSKKGSNFMSVESEKSGSDSMSVESKTGCGFWRCFCRCFLCCLPCCRSTADVD